MRERLLPESAEDRICAQRQCPPRQQATEDGSRLTVRLGDPTAAPLVFETGKIGRQAGGAVPALPAGRNA